MEEFNYNELVRKINEKEPFVFTRYGDGEFLAIWQDPNRRSNCDGHEYFPDLGKALKDVLKSNPNYYVGIQNLVKSHYTDKLSKFLSENEISIEFCNADMLHYASIDGNISSFFDALNGRDVIFVSPKYMTDINQYIKYRVIVYVSETNCWLQKDEIVDSMEQAVDILKKKGVDEENIVIILTASMTSNVVADIVHRKNNKITIIDAGSVFDPFVGKYTRTYHNKQDIVKKNGY